LLIEVNLAYAEKYGYSLEKAMEKEFTGKAKDGLLFTIGMKLKPFPTVAKLIKSACAGMGTNEMLLIACVVRYQVSQNGPCGYCFLMIQDVSLALSCLLSLVHSM